MVASSIKCMKGCYGSGKRENRNLLAVLAHAIELNAPRDEGEQRVIAADADVVARVHRGAPLADDDRPGGDELAAELLDAQPLALAVASVA